MAGIRDFAPVGHIEDINIREILEDFWICVVSREASVLARKEVLTGKAKFGITGDGKEVPQVAMARAWQKGDFRSGYYRDQTLIFALGVATVEDYFAQLYSDHKNDPFSRGRQMNSHFATSLIDKSGEWLDHRSTYNISADISPTAGQMSRALGLAYASKLYRENDELDNKNFSNNGNEVCFSTIGDASTSEGVFWETVNAACVLDVPLAVSVWDDGYGISVPIDYQTTKKSISKALKGFKLNSKGEGMHIYKAKAWNYMELLKMYQEGVSKMRENHKPALFHVQEVTQPQGHSTSGSHERYKSKERLEFEKNFDCIEVMREWIIGDLKISAELIEEISKHAVEYARNAKKSAWDAYAQGTSQIRTQLDEIYSSINSDNDLVSAAKNEFKSLISPESSEILDQARKMHHLLLSLNHDSTSTIKVWIDDQLRDRKADFANDFFASSTHSALNVPLVFPEYRDETPEKSGYQILNAFFKSKFKSIPELITFGEDVGKIGDVNQGMAGMQDEFSEKRVMDTGIREWTIVGQAIGLSQRGLRPIAEIQYLDYLIYALSPLSDDLATMRFRSGGKQQAPVIIRTRGHRLEGVWHAGSPMGMLVNSLRGIHLLVPRNMTVAAGFYNTLLKSQDPAIVIESLNGYRLKERMPDNLDEVCLPLGVPEVLKEGTDLTIVSYGSMVRIVDSAVEYLEDKFSISVELIDVQSLLPFDLEGIIGRSLKKTSRLLIVDEDVPGGGSAYILQKILEEQKGFYYLDAPPMTLTAVEHRPPYGSDGDYFCKPSEADVIDKVLELIAI